MSGVVTLDGELVDSGAVTFHPIDKGPLAYGAIRPDGSYTVRTGRGQLDDPDAGSIASGQYVATVVVSLPPEVGSSIHESGGGPPKPGLRVSPGKYSTVADSPFVVTIRAGDNHVPLEMKRDLPVEENAQKADAGGQADDSEDTNQAPADLELQPDSEAGEEENATTPAAASDEESP